MSRGDITVPEELAMFRRIKVDDTGAFKTLFLRYYEKLRTFIATVYGDSYLAEEVVQEVFIRLWEKRKAIEITCSVQYYLYSCCKNTAYNLLHKKAGSALSLTESNEQVEYQDPEEILSFHILQNDFLEAVNDLPEKAQKVFVLRYYHQTRHKEIARRLEISESMVEKHWANALKHLRKKLAVHYFQ